MTATIKPRLRANDNATDDTIALSWAAPAMRDIRDVHRLTATLAGGWWADMWVDDEEPGDGAVMFLLRPLYEACPVELEFSVRLHAPAVSVDAISRDGTGPEIDLGDFTTLTEAFNAMRAHLAARLGFPADAQEDHATSIDHRSFHAVYVRVPRPAPSQRSTVKRLAALAH